MTTVRRGGKGRKVMWELASVTGTPSMSPKTTAEHRGKEEKGEQGTGCKAPHTVFCIVIGGINSLLDTVCSTSRQRMVGKRHRGAKQLGCPLLWHELGDGTPLSPSLLTSTFASKPQPNSSHTDQTQPGGSCGATEFVPLCCMPDLICTKHMTREPGLPYCHFHQAPATSFAFLSSVNRFHAFIKWMY